MLVAREYRVALWQHQVPPVGSDTAPDEMAWTEVAIDLVDVSAVQDVVEWADSNMDTWLDKLDLGPSGGRRYVIYAKLPGDDTYVQLVGSDPTRSDDADNLPCRA